MSLLWWQNGRDIDWFSANLEKWIKPGVISTNTSSSQSHVGRYSKLKSCRLSKTCQTMMYIPQEQQARDLNYEEQLARFQDNRAYKYSTRQEHYNSHYNYIRTSARRAYYKPDTHEIVLADEYDKVQTIQRQNRAKNYDYLLLLQQFLRHQQAKVSNNGSRENIGTMTSYLNSNIQQYEQTDQTITLKQFLQEGIQKHEHGHLVTLKEFLQENLITTINHDSNKSTKLNEDNKEVTVQEFLKENCENNITSTFSSTNPFASDIMVRHNRSNPFMAQEDDKTNNKVNNNDQSIEEVSFEEFLKERQIINNRNESNQSIVKETNGVFPRPLHPIINLANDADTPQTLNSIDKFSFGEFLEERGRQNVQHSPIIKKTDDISFRSLNPKVAFVTGAESRRRSVDSVDKISLDEFLKDNNSQMYSPNISKSEISKVKFELGAETRSQSVDSNDEVTFDEFLKEDKVMTLEEFLKSEPIIHPDPKRLGKSNEHKAKVKNRNSLKLSKSFNDRTNMIKDNLIKKLTRSELQNENGKKKQSTEENNNDNKITLYEFLKEEDQKQTTDIENSLRNLKLRSKHDDEEMFYEINNNAPDIKLNDNIIQVETRTPEIKYNQYEHNKQVCACNDQIVLTGTVYNHNYNQLLSNNMSSHDRIQFVDKSYDYHRKVHQDNIMSSPFQHRTINRLSNPLHTQGRRSKSKNKPYVSPVGRIEEELYGPMWPSVLLTYDKVLSPNRMVYPNESYA